jgi:hypothetical protein
MLPATMHRRWAREYLDRADRAATRDDKLKYLQLAVRNTMRAQVIDDESSRPEQAEQEESRRAAE